MGPEIRKKHHPRRGLAYGLGVLTFFVLTSSVTQGDQDSFQKTQRELSQKAAEVKTLADELALLEATIDAKAAYLAEIDVKGRIARQKLARTNLELEKMQQARRDAQKVLNRYLRAAYIHRGYGQLAVLTGEKSLSQSLADESYLGSLQDYSTRVVRKVSGVEEEISKRQAEALAAYRSLDNLEAESVRETARLAAVRASKQRLLEQTAGVEARFRESFESAKERLKKAGRFARSARDRVASRVWDDHGYYFNQLDSRWIDEKLGYSKTSTMGDYGCGVSALAMVFKYYGINSTPPQLNNELKNVHAFVDDLLDWRAVPAASGGRLQLANNPYPVGRANVDWNVINSQLDSGNPVIVYIDRGEEISHYVVLLNRRGGTYVMHDPIEGPNLLFSSYYKPSAVYQYITFRRAA